MNYLVSLWTTPSPAQTVLILSAVIALGLSLGSIRIFGFQVGVAGVLFAGLAFGHFHLKPHLEMMEFVREFGLILFVYTIGVQVGPGFFASFRKEGLRLNMLALAVAVLGTSAAVLTHFVLKIPFPVVFGMLSGATTNTPSLAAIQQTMKDLPSVSAAAQSMPGLGYAVCYPFGVAGTILSMEIIKRIFKLSTVKEAEAYALSHAQKQDAMEIIDIRVDNPNLNGVTIKKIPAAQGVVISRIQRDDVLSVALPTLTIKVGDIIRAVGPKTKLDDLRLAVGSLAKMDFRGLEGKLISSRVVVTKKELAGKTVAEIDAYRFGVTITRIIRSEVEFTASPEVELNLADVLVVVGQEDDIKKFASQMGNSQKELAHPELIPVFVGLALGVMLGSAPFPIPGVPIPVKLGLAAGPLIVAILLSRVGRIGKIIWYMPRSANFMLREIGISLFLACVGLKSGDIFLQSLQNGDGLIWLLGGMIITLTPLLIIGFFAKLVYKMNFLSLCGLLAGATTDPPALAFANNQASSSAQVVAYAAVYPTVMFLRVIFAQLLVIFFSSGSF